MKVRIVREPVGTVDGIALHFYRAGEPYEVPAALGEYLVAKGYASIEMRRRQRSSRPRARDRRRSQGRG